MRKKETGRDTKEGGGAEEWSEGAGEPEKKRKKESLVLFCFVIARLLLFCHIRATIV